MDGVDEILSEVQAHSITSETGQDVTQQDLEDLIAVYEAHSRN
jgi:hypothetical protein